MRSALSYTLLVFTSLLLILPSPIAAQYQPIDCTRLREISSNNIHLLEQIPWDRSSPIPLCREDSRTDGQRWRSIVRGQLYELDMQSGVEQFTPLPFAVGGFSFSRDGRWMACNCSYADPVSGVGVLNSVRVLNTETLEQVFVLEDVHGAGDFSFDATGRYLAYSENRARRGNYAHLWDLQTNQHLMQLEYGEGIVNDVDLSPDDTMLAVAFERQIEAWDIQTNTLLYTLMPDYLPRQRGLDWQFEDLAFSHSGDFLAAISPLGHAWAYDARSGELVMRYINGFAQRRMEGYYSTIGFSEDDSLLIMSDDDYLFFWDFQTSHLLKLLTLPMLSRGFSLDHSGKFLRIYDRDGLVELWGVRASAG